MRSSDELLHTELNDRLATRAPALSPWALALKPVHDPTPSIPAAGSHRDRLTDAWEAVAPHPLAKLYASAAAVLDGKLYVVDGAVVGVGELSSVERDTGLWMAHHQSLQLGLIGIASSGSGRIIGAWILFPSFPVGETAMRGCLLREVLYL